ncbi:MAG TPA: hypothetical protein PLF98_03580 [Thermotogota bacterium]|nr:hypothetical protein [Thermotogota bacterium]HQC37367.1 hypothetical protein [Thermotogota bacterium]
MAKKETLQNTQDFDSKNKKGEQPVTADSLFTLRKMLRNKEEAQVMKAVEKIEQMNQVEKELLADIKNYLWQRGSTVSDLTEKMSKLFQRFDPEGYEAFILLRNKSMGNLPTKEKRPMNKPMFEEEAKDFGDPQVELVGELDIDDEDEEEND